MVYFKEINSNNSLIMPTHIVIQSIITFSNFISLSVCFSLNDFSWKWVEVEIVFKTRLMLDNTLVTFYIDQNVFISQKSISVRHYGLRRRSKYYGYLYEKSCESASLLCPCHNSAYTSHVNRYQSILVVQWRLIIPHGNGFVVNFCAPTFN